MQPLPKLAAPTSVTKTQYDDTWSITARGGFKVFVSWHRLDGGTSVSGMVCDERGGEPLPFRLGLDAPQQAALTLALTHTDGGGRISFIDVTLTLVRNDGFVSLRCNLPVAINEFFDDAIGSWSLGPAPSPDDGDSDDEIVIEAPGDATDLFPFIWLRPLSDAESADAALRFVRCANPSSLPLYTQLAGTTATAKRTTATTYISGTDFVSDITKLGSVVALFPSARLKFMALQGTLTIDALVQSAQDVLLIPSLTDFLQSTAWTSAQSRSWSSIFALALAGQAAQMVLCRQLLDIMRVGQYLTLLVPPTIAPPSITTPDDTAADNPQPDSAQSLPPQPINPLINQTARQISLSAIVAIPDPVAALPPAPAISGTGTGTLPDTWEVLGVGKLKMARQHLAGYAPGELADVVNVMPRERQELLEHTVTTTAERSSDNQERTDDSGTSRETSAASELADTVNEVMAADGAAVNMNNVTPQYVNLNMLLTGSGSNSQARSAWSSADTSRMVQRLTEQAAKRLGDRVSHQRGKEWQELRERRQSQLIDNADNDRLVGIYRWVDRVVRVHVEDLGPRLVLAFVLEQPAQNWVAAVAAQGTFPLQKPVALTSLAATYAALTPSNYQTIGAQYGLLALEPPPPDQLTVAATINRVTPGDLSLLCVPDGYTVLSCAVTVALSDNSYNLACSVGGYDLPTAAVPASVPLQVNVPACTTTSTGPMVVTPPNQPSAVINTTALTGLKGATGRIPVTVMSSAPLFGVTVTLTCTQAVTTAEPVNPLMTAWQMRLYERLENAWRDASQSYDTALLGRIDLASARHSGEVQRDTLKQACMNLLLQVSDTTTVNPRLLEPLLDWAHMTWQYQSPTSASSKNWPESNSAEATRPSSDRLFQRFLAAQTARVLLPVNPEWESWLLFYLQFQQFWNGGPAGTPMTESTLPLMEEVLRPEVEGDDGTAEQVRAAGHWSVRVPTSMIYLQQGDELPQMRQSAATVQAGAN